MREDQRSMQMRFSPDGSVTEIAERPAGAIAVFPTRRPQADAVGAAVKNQQSEQP
jgi:hypothetical protein